MSKLCADILKFLTRAHKWYCEGFIKRTIHSLTQPFDLRYEDILKDIRRGSYVVEDLAECGQLVEQRHVNQKIDQIVDTVTVNFSRIDSTLDRVVSNINDLNARSIAAEAINIQRLNEISTTTSREFLIRRHPSAHVSGRTR